MYYGIYKEKQLIAYHDDPDICSKYILNIYYTNKTILNIYPLKKKDLKNLNEDLYLTPYGKTYIQMGYVKYLEIVDSGYLDDLHFTKDILYRTIKKEDLTKKEKKILEKTIHILEDITYDLDHYTPDINDLNKYKSEYEPYLNNNI